MIESTPNADELASVTARRRGEEIAKTATANQAATEAAAKARDAETAAKTAATAAATDAIGTEFLDNILEDNTTIKVVPRAVRRGVDREERFLKEGVGHGFTLEEIRSELGRNIPYEDTGKVLEDMGYTTEGTRTPGEPALKLVLNPRAVKKVEDWYDTNKVSYSYCSR